MTDLVKEELKNKNTDLDKKQEKGNKSEKNYNSYHRPNLDFQFDEQNNSVDPLESVVEIEELDINRTINIASLGPGSILKNAREQANLSKDDVAKELRLATRHIEYLEQDAYHKFTAVAFYIGYIRNYSKLLDVDPDKMIAKFYAVYKVKPEMTVSNASQATTAVSRYNKIFNLWPLSLFFDENKSYKERVKNIKLLMGILVVSIIFMLTWWLLSKNNNMEAVLASSKDKIESMSPDKVDEYVPSSPVIVKNTSNLNNNKNKEQVTKKVMLDNFS